MKWIFLLHCINVNQKLFLVSTRILQMSENSEVFVLFYFIMTHSTSWHRHMHNSECGYLQMYSVLGLKHFIRLSGLIVEKFNYFLIKMTVFTPNWIFSLLPNHIIYYTLFLLIFIFNLKYVLYLLPRFSSIVFSKT